MIKIKNKDIRLNSVDFEVRGVEDDVSTHITGYALKFDRPSEDLGFTEYIERGALDKADMSNVVALLNHDSNYVLGRTGKNLVLEVDDIGLRFDIKATETAYTKDLIENMRNGLIDKCSFAFTIADEGDEWSKDENDRYIRRIRSINKLYDVSVVTTPAYQDTEVVLSQRCLNKLKQDNRQREIEIMEMELNLI